MEEIKVQLIFIDAALAAALEELASKRLQVSGPETVEAHSDARTRQLKKP
jgi:hypothetical protein